jgi:hypothetical protein
MTNGRVTRGRQTQNLAAAYLHCLFPSAYSVAASLPGKDIKNTPGLSIEVKATTKGDITGALRQAVRNSDPVHEKPLVIWRPVGYGPERIADWVVAVRFGDAIDLLGRAGYGD